MNSMRARLLMILLLTTGAVWASAATWIYISTQAQVERVLDARLREAARMVSSMVTDERVHLASAADAVSLPDFVPRSGNSYQRQLSCQIWSMEGALVSRSDSAPETRLAGDADGFSISEVDGEEWRVFTVANAERDVRVMVGDNMHIRNALVRDVMLGTLLPMTLFLPLGALVIWFSVRRGMAPLDDMASTIASRHGGDLQPVKVEKMPSEMLPVICAMNGLFQRVAAARQRETAFTSFAAHELKTPLAGLKTQAQIALASGDADVQANALRQIGSGVDRTSRLVRQLLDLAAIEAADQAPELLRGRPAQVVEQVVEELPTKERSRIRIEQSGSELEARFEPALLQMAVRNLIENAIRHSPDDREVLVRLAATGNEVEVLVEDEGPGIPESELPHVTERFFRGRDRAAAGSGLGLSIAEEAVMRIEGVLRLRNRDPHGVSAVVLLQGAGD